MLALDRGGLTTTIILGVNAIGAALPIFGHSPLVLAISALHQYAGVPHHIGIGKHYWIVSVIGGTLIVALATWIIRRRNAGSANKPATEPARKKTG